jgi:ABC-2 type transport system permease protein
MLWTVSGDGVNRIGPALIFIFSGAIVPLPLFPDWMQTLLEILPFRGLADTPCRIYMGHILPHQAIYAIIHQLAWVFVIILIGVGWCLRVVFTG